MINTNVRLRDMTDDEFDKFITTAILSYSEDLIKSGRCREEEALESSKNQFNELLPQGKNTKDNFIYTAVNNENENVGLIWYKNYKEDLVFICDFLILEQFRKKGYGKQTLLLAEQDAKAKGFNEISLHVFKFNTPAISLYESIGYKLVNEEPGSMFMMKDI